MDHKVSKDMISSGMIPSGEKTQADLGRTQYGSAPSPSSLMDAYKSIYEHHQKDADGNTIPHEGEELTEMDRIGGGLGLATKVIGGGINALQKVSKLGQKLGVIAGGSGVGVGGGKLMHDAIKSKNKSTKNKTQTNSHELEGDQLDEINAGYSTDAGLASTGNMKQPVKKRETGRERLYRLGRGPRPKSLGPTKAQQIRKKLIGSGTAKNPETSLSDIRAKQKQQVKTNALQRNVDFRAKRRPDPKPMPSNFSGGVSGKGKATDDFSSQYKSNAGTSTNIKTKRPMGRSAVKRRNMMNDVDLFDLIKGAFIEEGYNESDALSFMVEANQEYLTELDREMTMLGVAGASAIPFVAKKLFGKKVDKAIDKQRKTSPIGGDNRAKKIEKAAGAEGFFK